MSIKTLVPIKATNSFLGLQTDPALKNLTRLPEAGTRLGLAEDDYGNVITGIPESERAELEKELGLKSGQLSTSSEFWRTSPAFKAGITIPAEGLTLDLGKAEDKVKWYLMQTYDILQTGAIRKASHEFYVKDEEQELKVSSEKLTKKKFLYGLYVNWNLKDKRDFLYASGVKHLGLSELKIDDLVSTRIEDKTAESYELLKDPRYNKIVMLEKLLTTSVITYSPQLMRYEFQDEALAETKDGLLALLARQDEKTGALVQRIRLVYADRLKSNEYVDLASETDLTPAKEAPAKADK
jgi:hypothetical protein